MLGMVIMGLVLLAVSPVLRTLTESTTSDSIWALSAMLFFLHLVLADYSSTPNAHNKGGKLSDTLSFNAAISASVVLASRLETNIDTFTLLTLAIFLFAPSTPSLTLLTRGSSARGEYLRFAMVYITTMAVAFSFVGKGWMLAVVGWTNAVVVFVSAACPWWIRSAQAWKMEIKGPWDPAEPILSSSSHAHT